MLLHGHCLDVDVNHVMLPSLASGCILLLLAKGVFNLDVLGGPSNAENGYAVVIYVFIF